MNVVTMTKVHDPLNRADQETEKYEFRPGVETVADLMQTVVYPSDELVTFVVSVNGHPLLPIEWSEVKLVEGLHITIMPVIQGGGGGGGKNPLRTILMIIVVVVAAWVSGGAGGAAIFAQGGALAGYAGVAGAAVLVGGSMLVNAIAPVSSAAQQQTPALNGASSINQSNAYSWNPQTTQQQGVAMPVAYGTCKLTGNIIGAYREAVGASQYLNVLISLGEGPIANINSLKINGQPLENYRGVTVNTRPGRLSQSVIPGFGDTQVEYALAEKVVYGSPVSYTTIGSNFDGLEIEVAFPNGLFYYDDSGNLTSNSVSYRIEIRPVGGAWQTITQQVKTTTQTLYNNRWSRGTWTNPYLGFYYMGVYSTGYWNEVEAGSSVRTDHYEGELGADGTYWRWISTSYEATVSTTYDYVTTTAASQQIIRLTHKKLSLSAGQYEIRVTNLTPDQTSSRYGDDLYLAAVREIISDDFTYPGEVLVGLRALATDQLSGSFSFECRTTGKLCRVYRSGLWYVEPTNNPAWVCWDILTQPVFNDDNTVAEYRAHDPSKLDLTRWSEWADYCNDLVPDGKGGTEARLTWDGPFDSQKTMWDQALAVAAIGRATPYWRGNTITIAIDKAATPGFLISVGNIGKDSFDEVYLAMDGRAGSVEADFLNVDNDLNRDKMTIVNYDAPDGWGASTASLQGEIRPSGIYRQCKFKLARTQALTRLVTVEMSTDSIAFTLGDVGNVQHDVPRWGEGGRLVAATSNSVTIDKSVVVESGKNYAISVRYQDNTVVEKTLNNTPGTYTVLTFAAAFSSIPAAYDVWAFGEVGTYIKPMRVVGIEPKSDLKKTIILEDYNASIYTLDNNLPLLSTINYTPNPAPVSVTNLTLTERLVVVNGVVSTILVASWDAISTTSSTLQVEVLAGVVGRSLISQAKLPSLQNSIEIPVTDGETWQVIVLASNTITTQSIASAPSATKTIIGKLAPPEDVVNLRSSPTSFGGLILSWDSVSDLDVKYGGYYAIRYSSALTGVTWENSLELTTVTATSVTIPAALDGSYLVKAVDTGGHESINAIMLVTNIPSLIAFNFIQNVTDGVTWGGTHAGTYTVGGKLYLDMAGSWDAITDFDSIGNIDGYGGVLLSGYYTLADSVDLGSVQTARCGLAIDFDGVDSAALWDDIVDFDAVATFSGLVPGVGVQPQISVSDDNITWNDWAPYINGDYTARYFKFRLKLYTNNPQNYPEVTQFVATIDMPDRTEKGNGISVVAGGTAITFSKQFMTTPIVRASNNNAQSGDTNNITGITTIGATLQVLNGGVGVARIMDWQAVGY